MHSISILMLSLVTSLAHASQSNDAGDAPIDIAADEPAALAPERAEGVHLNRELAVPRQPIEEIVFVAPTPERTEVDLTRSIDELTPTGPLLGEGLRFHFDRPTEFRDTGVDGLSRGFGGGFDEDRLPGYANDQGEFDVYDLTLRWDAWNPGPLTLAVVSGLKAIKADISESVDEFDASGSYVSTRLEGVLSLEPIPVIGGEVRLLLSEGFLLTGSAATQTTPGNQILDVLAETTLRISPTIGLRAGYQYIDAELDFDPFDARLDQSGVFARIEIKF